MTETTCSVCSYPAFYSTTINLKDINTQYDDLYVDVFKCMSCGNYEIILENNDIITDYQMYQDIINYLTSQNI